ncbi:MAG: ABC transporter substrate-binding protein [Microbacteriaceae bacterium]|nr:ABC transporter substrate-binding protein [Microbacteriaceae bacterium]MCL2796092.1 ABC transporter substrate-binding protein [Microbacteriaceae bacterium]
MTSINPFGAPASRRGFLAIAGAAAISVTLAACGKSTNSGSGGSGGSALGIGNNGKKGNGRSGTAADTLFIGGFQWGPAANFNPFSPSAAWPAQGNVAQYLYETPLRFNIVTGELLPGLAKSYKVDGLKVTLTFQDGAKWSDGQPLTSADFAYTYQLGKLDPTNSIAGLWTDIDSIETPDATTAVVNVNTTRKNTAVVLQNIAQTYVYPQHIWSEVIKSNPQLSTYQTMKPVGSGPFSVSAADQTQVVLTRNDSYWGKTFYGGSPVFSKVIHPIFKSNDDANLQFQNGQMDVMQTFIPQIWKTWENGKPIGTYLKASPYYVPGSIPMFIINTTKPGLNDPAVRKAMAYAIDTASIAETAMSGYSDKVVASLMMPSGSEAKYLDKAKAQSDGWTYDAAKAEQTLKDAGYTKGSDGIYAKGGVRLGQWKLITPTGWTDWNAALTIVAKNFKAIGIDAVTYFPQAADCTTQVQNGQFDCACWYVAGASPATPWQRFSDVMSNVSIQPIGKAAFNNYGRFKNDQIDGMLQTAAAAADDASKTTALQALDDLYRQNVPSIPLMYRPDEFYQYAAVNFYNWPDEKNNYAPPMFRGAGNTWIYKLKKIGS